MEILESLTYIEAIVLFVLSAIVIAIGGTLLSREADRLADLSGLGEALVGAIFLGAVTSLSGLATSFTAALEGHPHLSVSNAIGGIAAQTVFLALADITYPKANLEHAAPSLSNIMQAVLLMFMLAFMLGISQTPEFDIMGVHPASILIVIVYLAVQRMISRSEQQPMWLAVKTKETLRDIPEEENLYQHRMSAVLIRFILLGVLIAVAGYTVAKTGIIIAVESGISESIVGAIFTAVASSLPELIVSIAAVRQGALTLAVSNVLGGNSFDILFVAFSDFAYEEGSILHTFEKGQTFIISLTLMLTAILTLGLLDRQKKGFAGIGWESLAVLLLFTGGYSILFFI